MNDDKRVRLEHTVPCTACLASPNLSRAYLRPVQSFNAVAVLAALPAVVAGPAQEITSHGLAASRCRAGFRRLQSIRRSIT